MSKFSKTTRETKSDGTTVDTSRSYDPVACGLFGNIVKATARTTTKPDGTSYDEVPTGNLFGPSWKRK